MTSIKLKSSQVSARASEDYHNKPKWSVVTRTLYLDWDSRPDALQFVFLTAYGRGHRNFSVALDEDDYDAFLDAMMKSPGGAERVSKALTRFISGTEGDEGAKALRVVK